MQLQSKMIKHHMQDHSAAKTRIQIGVIHKASFKAVTSTVAGYVTRNPMILEYPLRTACSCIFASWEKTRDAISKGLSKLSPSNSPGTATCTWARSTAARDAKSLSVPAPLSPHLAHLLRLPVNAFVGRA